MKSNGTEFVGNDTKNNKHNSFNQAIDTTAVLGRQSHFGPAAVLSSVKKHTLFPQNQHFSYPKRCTALRTALLEKKVPFLIFFFFFFFFFTHRYNTDQGVP